MLLSGCAEDARGTGKTPTPVTPDPTMNGPIVQPADDAVVYGHSATMLFTVDPDTLAVKPVANFVWPSGPDEMTDIALDKDGNMVGISFGAVYAIDKSNAKCTFLSHFSGASFNGLSFIYATVADVGQEILVGASTDGSVYKINPMTGAQTLIGSYGSGWGSSGDLVSVAGATYATVSGPFDSSDTLVTVDPTTGKATKIGSTGVSNIWGLGYWKQKLFGFTESSGLVLININTGAATPISNGGTSWYGAGVTTAAPTTVQ